MSSHTTKTLSRLIVPVLLASILGGFLLKINPAQAVVTCATIEECAAEANGYVERVKYLYEEFKVQYKDDLSKDVFSSIEGALISAQKTAESVRSARSVEEAQMLTQQTLDEAKRASSLMSEERTKSLSSTPWWYYLTRPGEAILVILGTLLNLVLSLIGKLIMLVAKAVSPLLTWADFTGITIVQTGWGIVRDVANMFFSLILLIIAFATILRRESYGMKALLPKLVLAALLINFSLLIATPFLDFSGVLTNYFVNASLQGQKSISEATANFLQIATIFVVDKAETIGLTAGYAALASIIFGLIGGIFYALTTLFVLIALVILLLIRIVYIWFLLIIVPAAWLLWILPSTSNLFRRWWSTFLKWCFFAPIFAFFFYLALTARNALNLSIQQKMLGAETATGLLSAAFNLRIILQMLLSVGLLVGGLIAAQKMGIYGASGLIKVGRNLNRSVTRSIDQWIAKGAEKEGFKGIPRRMLSYLSPTAWKMAWADRKKQKEREAYPIAAGKRQDMLNRFITWKSLSPAQILRGRIGAGERTDFAERAKRRREQEERKDIYTKNSEERIAGFMEARRNKNVYKMAAYAEALAEENDVNELFNHLGKIYKTNKYTFGQKGFKNFVDDILKPAMGEQGAYRVAHDINRIQEGTGNWGLTRKYFLDPFKKTWEEVNDVKAREESMAQWSKQEAQSQARYTGRLSLIEEGWDPETGEVRDFGLTPLGKMMIKGLQQKQASRLFAQTMAVLIGRHAEETETINKPLYDAIVSDQKFNEMNRQEVEAFINGLKNTTNPVASGAPGSSYEPPQQGFQQGAGI